MHCAYGHDIVWGRVYLEVVPGGVVVVGVACERDKSATVRSESMGGGIGLGLLTHGASVILR
jgi:hypothetical protein